MRKRIFTLAMVLALLLVSVGIKAQSLSVYEGFESWNTGNTAALATGWDKQDYAPGASSSTSMNSYLWYVSATAGVAHGGTKYAYLYAHYTYTAASRLKTPVYVVPSTGNYRLSFWLRNSGTAGSHGDFTVYYSLDGGTTYLSNPIPGLQHISTGSVWTEYDALLPDACKGQSVTIVFEGAAGPSTIYYYYLDDITIASAPTCWTPVNPLTSNLTGNSANFSWDLNAKYGVHPDQFSVTLKDSAGNVVYYNPAVAYDTTGNHQQFSFTGLQGNTTYTASVRSNCDIRSFHGFSDSVSVTFTTLTPAINPPLFQNFDTLTTGTFPGAGYYAQNASLNNAIAFAHSGTNSLKLTTTANGLAYVMFPLMNLAADNFEVDLWIRRASTETTTIGPVSYKIGYLADPSDIGNLVPIYFGTLAGDVSWRNIRVNSYDPNAPDPTTPVMICIQVDAGLATSVYIDDVDIHVKPTCTRPENMTVSDVTTNSAVLAWDMANASSFNVRAMAPDSTYVTATATGSPFTMTGLEQNTRYEFSVQGVCSATDLSDWAVAAAAKTLCGIADTALFVEDFSSWTAGVGDCWNTGWFVKPSGNTLTMPFSMVATSGNYHSVSKGMSLAQQADGSLSYLSSQKLPIDSANKYVLSIWVKRAVSTASMKNDEGIQIWMTDAPDDTAGGVMLGYIHREPSLVPVATLGWNEYEFVIPVQGNKHVMIVGVSENGQPTYFDDIEIKIAPDCPKVKGIVPGAVTATSASVAWIPGSEETQWVVNYELQQGTTATDTTIITNNANYTIDNLVPATAYTISGSVRALCGVGDTAEAVAFGSSFTTLCQDINSLPYTNNFDNEATGASTSNAAPTCWTKLNDATVYFGYPYVSTSSVYAHSGSKVLYFYSSTIGTYANHQVAILPAVDTTVYPIGTLRMSFWAARNTTSSYADAPMIVGVMSDPSDITTFTVIDTITVINSSPQKYVVELSGYSGNGKYIALRLDRQAKNCYCYIDDVTLEEIPSCIDLKGAATISEISESSVRVALADATATSSWSYAYGVAGTPVAEMTAIDTTVGTIVINNLAAATIYDLYVRRNCGNNDYSPWAEKVTFSTTAIPAQAPYACGFEDAVENAKWMFVDGASANVFTIGQATTGVYSGTHGMYVTTNRTTAPHTYITSSSTKSYAYRTFHFNDKGYQIEMKVKATGGQSTYDYGRILLTTTSEVLPAGTTGALYASTQFPDAIAELDENFVYSNCKLLNCSTYTSGNPDADGWITLSYFLDMTNRAGNYNLVLMWHDYSSGGKVDYPLAVDDITITELSCIPPSTIIPNISATSLGLAVNQPIASQWEFIVDTVAFTKETAPANPKFRISSTDGTATATGLTPNTQYWYSVRTICDTADTSAWLDVESVRTFCAPYALPYTEGFENADDAYCWTLASGQSADAAVARTSSPKRSGVASLTATKATVISPEFIVDSLTHYMLSGWAYSTTKNATVSVGVMTDPNDLSTFELLTDVTIPAASTWTEFTVYFNLLSDPDYEDFKNAKHIVLATGSNTVSFDDILVGLAPTCPKPSDIHITNITNNSFDISFTDNANASRWVVYVNDVANIITNNPATISGLDAHTNYDVKIAAICSATDTSFVKEYGTVTTLCDLMQTPWVCGFEPAEGYVGNASHNAACNLTVNAENNCWNVLNNRAATASSGNPYAFVSNSSSYLHSGLQSAFVGGASNSSSNICLILPAFSDSANMLKVKFWYKNSNTNANAQQPKFGYFADATEASFVTIEELTKITTWTEKEYFTNDTSYNIPANARLGFLIVRGTATGNFFLDDISIYQIRSCSDPNVPTVMDVLSTTADIAFTDTCAAHTAWEYVYGEAGFNPNTATATPITATSFTLTDLDAATDYEVYVRAVCGVGDVSNFVKTSFRTLCTPFHVTAATPFIEDFNDYGYGQFMRNGTCYIMNGEPANSQYWAKIYPTSTPSATTSIYYNYGHSDDRFDKFFYWYMYANQMADGMVLRQFHLDGGTTYEISAWVRNGNDGMFQSKVSAMMGVSKTSLDTMNSRIINGETTSSRIVEGKTIYPFNELYQEIKYYVTPDSTGDYFIGYNCHNSNGYAYTYLYLDDWAITALAGCAPVVPTVDSVNTHAAYISVGDNAAYQYEYVLNDSTATPTAVAGNRFVIDSLNPSTTYMLYLRKYCNATTHSQWMAVTFATACGPISKYPYTEGFEGSFPPVCWNQFSYGTTDNTWDATSYPLSVRTGTYAAAIPNKTAGAKTVLTTGEFVLNNPTGYYLRFWMYRANDTYDTKVDEALHVGYMNAPITSTNIAAVHELIAINRHVLNTPVEPAAAGYYMYEVEIPGNVTGSTWFSFDFHNQYGGGICIDDITIEPVPSCVGPKTAPTVASTTMTTATVTVDMNNKAKAEVAWALGTAPNTIIGCDTTNSGTVVATGLAANTMYTFKYRYICSAGDTSIWSNYSTATTTATDCFAPQNIRTAGIVNDHHAMVTWGGAPEALAYEYELKRGTSLVTAATTTADTLVFDTLVANSSYTIRVRTLCAADTSGWVILNFTTTFPTFTLPFICDFENAAQNSGWHFNLLSSSGNNGYAIGSGTNNGGLKSLYVSDDGTTYNYAAGSESVSDAEILLEIPAGNYLVSYDWYCKGEGTTTQWDYGRVFLVPSDVVLSGSTYTAFHTLPASAIPLDRGAMNNSNGWTNASGIYNVPATGLYKFVVTWCNDGSGGEQPPFAIDNIRIENVACMPVNLVFMNAINSRDAEAVVVRHDASVAVEYALSLYEVVDSVSAWTVAANDTLSFTGLVPGNDYTVFVRHACDSATKSPIKSVTFSTSSNAVSLPFIATFEANDTTNGFWLMTSGTALNWYTIGSATYASGQRSMYVTDNGSSHHYTCQTGALVNSYAYIPIQFTAGVFDVSYQWYCHGESTYDYGHVFLAPATMVPHDNVLMTGMSGTSVPTGTISLDGNYARLNSLDSLNDVWFDVATEITINNAGTYNLIVAWHNNATVNHQPPLAIDNIRIKELTCVKPDADKMSVDSSSTDMFRMKVADATAGKGVVYHVASDASFSDTVAAGIVYDSLVTVTGLTASTWYYAKVGFVCAVGDTSSFTTLRVRTDCGVITTFPYDEDFESYASGSANKSELTHNCWMVAAYTTGTTQPYHYMTTTSSYVHGGSKALYVYNAAASGAYQTFAMPKVDNLAGKRLSMWYKNYSSSSSDVALLEVGYLANPNDMSTFASLTTAPYNSSSFSEVAVNYPATIPAGARPAFKANGTYYLYIDDIHINNLVQGQTYYDTICFGQGYNAHGFSCPAGTLAAGDTVFNDVICSTSAGVADSMIRVNLYVRPEINNAVYDTVCPGMPYTRGMFNIQNPVTDTYFRTFPSVSGCDSTVYLHLYVLPSTENIYDTICEGDAYQFGTQTLTQGGTYYDTVPSGYGCDIVRVLNLYEVATETHQYEQVCIGASFTWEGQTYTQAGTYSKVVSGAAGCSLTKYLHLTMTPTDSICNVSFCQGGSVQVADTVIMTAGTYTFTRVNRITGCNTTYHVTATVIQPTPEYVSDEACEGKPYYGYGISGDIITKDTTITQNTRTAAGNCDSVVIATIRLNPTTYGATEYVEIAAGESYTWHDNTYSTSGIYYATEVNSNGCDSICKLNLTVGGVSPTGVDDVEMLNISLVPNPVNAGETSFIYGNFTDVKSVEILNSFGQVIDTFVPSGYPIEVQGINASGIYYVRVTTEDNQVAVEKLIVR